MDRDVALSLLGVVTNIKTTLQTIAANTTPTEAAASVNDSRAEAALAEEPEPVTKEVSETKGGK